MEREWEVRKKRANQTYLCRKLAFEGKERDRMIARVFVQSPDEKDLSKFMGLG